MKEIEQPIPWAKPEFWGNEEQYVREALKSSWISGGPFVNRLETQFAHYNGIAHAVATSNGTAALHLAYLAAEIRPGDEVIVPGYAFMAAANVLLHVGAVPVFADIDPHTWCVTVDEVQRRLSPQTRAIVPVHSYGNVCAMDEIVALAQHGGLCVIEDAAEAFGSRYRGRMAGTIARLGTYSMHATKTITTGEGGMVVTDDVALKEKMLLYRSHGMSRTRYWHEVAGHNFRLTNMQSALGCAQLEQIETIVLKRKQMYDLYRRHLHDVPGVVMQSFTQDVEPVVWVIAIKLDPSAFAQGRDEVMRELAAAHIETRPGFYTPSRMRHLYVAQDLPVCNDVSDWVIALPSFPSLTEQQIEYICSRIRRIRR